MKNLVILLIVIMGSTISAQSIFIEYEGIGHIHNQFLENVNTNFHPDFEESDYNKRLDYLKDFQIANLKNTEASSSNKDIMLTLFENNKGDMDIVKFYSKAFDESTGVYKQIEELKENDIIDSFSYNSLVELLKACEDRKGIEELKPLVKNLKSKADEYYEGRNTEQSRLLAVSLQISSASLEWWEANLPNISTRRGGRQSVSELSSVIAPWIAADVVGGVASGAVAAGAQYVTTGEVGNWGAVAISAGAVAILASTGATTGAAKWIVSLF